MVGEYAFCLAAQTGKGEAIATVSQRVTLTGTIEDARPSEEPTPRPTPGVDDASVGPARRSGSSTGCTTGGIGNSGCHGRVFVGCGTTPPYRDCAARALRGCGRAGPVGRTARAAKLLKLRVERLPVGADAGIAETAVLRVSFGHNLTGTMTH